VYEGIKLPESIFQYVTKMIAEPEFTDMIEAFTRHQDKRRNEPWFREYVDLLTDFEIDKLS